MTNSKFTTRSRARLSLALSGSLLALMSPDFATANTGTVTTQKSAGTSPRSAKNSLSQASISESEDGTTTIRISGDHAPTFNVYRLNSPERLVVDLSETQQGSIPAQLRGDTWAVSRLLVKESTQSGVKLVRVVIDLARDASYIVVPNGNDLVVTLSPKDPPPESRQARLRALAAQAQASAEVAKANAAKDDVAAQAQRLREEAAATQTKLDQAKQELATIAKQQANARIQLDAEQSKLAVMQAAQRKQKTKSQDLTKVQEAVDSRKQELARFDSQIRAQKSAIAVAQTQADHARKELAVQNLAVAQAKAKAAAYEEKANDAQARAQAAQGQEKQLSQKVAQANAELQAAQKAKQHELALAANAQSQAKAAQQVQQDSETKARELLRTAESVLEKARAEQKEADAASEKANALLKQLASAHAKSTDKSQKSQAATALAQAKQAADEALAQKKVADTQVARLAKDSQELSAAVKREERARKQAEAQLQQKEAKIAELTQEIEKAHTELRRAPQVLAADLAQAKKRLSQAQTAQFALEQEVQRLREAQKQADVAAQAAAKKLATAKANPKQDSSLIAAQNAAKRAQDEAEQARQQLAARRSALEGVQATIAAENEKVAELGSQQAKLSSTNRLLASEQQKLRKELAQDEQALDKVRQEALNRENQLAALDRKVAAAKAQLNQTLLDLEQAADRQPEKQSQQIAVATKAPQVAPQVAPKAAPKAIVPQLRDVRVEDRGDAVALVIDWDSPIPYEERRLTPSMQLLVFEATTLPKNLQRTLDASALQGSVSKVTSYTENGETRVMVAALPEAQSYIEQDEKQLTWVFPKQLAANQVARPVRMVDSEVAPVALSREAGDFESSIPAAPTPSNKPKAKWHGERIDIELQDAPIKDVLLLFSDIGHVNIIAGKDVTGSITMKLSAVPWDQALDIILRSLGLGMVREGNVIRVSTQSQIEEEQKKAIERANAQVQLKPLETRLIPLSYAIVGDMVPKVQSVLSARGTVTPDTRTNMLIIMDVAENIALAEQLIGQLDSQTPQVLIEARIVEARTSWLRRLGIQWGFDVMASPGTGNPTGLLFPNSVAVGGGAGANGSDTRGLILPGSAASPNYAVDLPAPVGPGTGGAIGLSFGSIAGNVNTNLRLSAAEDEGEVRLISAPKVVAMDNTSSKIEQGVQIPISQVSQNGVNTRYVNATLGLEVTPHVTNEGSVILEVKVQKNEADFINTGARGDPTILTKQAESKMLILDGDTAVIGGIYTRNQSISHKKIPWIADIPIVGWFFKNRAEADTRTELLIFLTPKIINRSTSVGG